MIIVCVVKLWNFLFEMPGSVSLEKPSPQHGLRTWPKALIMASLSLVLASVDDCKGRFLGEVS